MQSPKKNMILVFLILGFIALAIALYLFNQGQDYRGVSSEEKKVLKELEDLKRRPNDTKTEEEVLKELYSLKAPLKNKAEEERVLKELESLKP
ncbi:MAG: hypothetical protein AAB873_00945 [Patescibacteria group bacterium]